jgi:2-polyprenyl-3-methyl-5-hydroxy-6-metoxy-1,4-benzoquinol methylase
MYRLAPGHILQLLYLKERLRARSLATFIEVGAGNGYLSHALLGLGLTGSGFDLNAVACAENREANADAIAAGHYRVRQEDFLAAETSSADLIISSMVIEHLDDGDVQAYFARCVALLRPGGLIVTLVPASPRHWGIEDDIAGHKKRYVRADFAAIARQHALRVAHLAGLTWPVSNLLLGISNRLVRRAETWKLELDDRAKTVESGYRKVRGKTEFPDAVQWLVNEFTMYPLHMVQRAFRDNANALVLYAEMERA